MADTDAGDVGDRVVRHRQTLGDEAALQVLGAHPRRLLHEGPGGGDFVMRANDVEYFAPAVFDDEIEVWTRVARLGRTSVTFAFAAYRLPDDLLMVTAHQTLVYVDLAQRHAHEVPAAFRDRVLAFEGDDVEG
jgi:YbgC/YbaW family acyl-CoA thioester hydrolase